MLISEDVGNPFPLRSLLYTLHQFILYFGYPALSSQTNRQLSIIDTFSIVSIQHTIHNTIIVLCCSMEGQKNPLSKVTGISMTSRPFCRRERLAVVGRSIVIGSTDLGLVPWQKKAQSNQRLEPGPLLSSHPVRAQDGQAPPRLSTPDFPLRQTFLLHLYGYTSIQYGNLC